MQSIIFFISFLVFLYMLYKLVKDDYVFIRKGILPEQAFDITFFASIVGLLLSRFFSLIFQLGFDKKVFLSFFSFQNAGLSLSGFVIGSLAVLWVLGNKKKIALGRFFDFFTLSFLPALAICFLLSSLFLTGERLLITLSYALFYSILTVCFFRFLKPQLLNRTLKEGKISLFFLMIFALFLLIDTLFLKQLGSIIILHGENIIAFLLFLGSIIVYFQQEGGRRR